MIDVKEVHYTYQGTVEALRGVSTSIAEGELVAVMGENGAGKTTLMKHLNGLLKPTRGKVVVNGTDTSKSTPSRLSRSVGLVFQSPDHQLFNRTVREEVEFALKRFGFGEDEVKSRANGALDLMGVKEYADKSPFLLSLGERKRVATAAILAWDPPILVMDEPTIGQDQALKDQLRRIIEDRKKEGKTVIMVTHDVEFTADLGPRVILMARGKIISDGPAAKILTDLHSLSSASLTLPQIPQIVAALQASFIPSETLTVHDLCQAITKKMRGM